MRFARCKCRRPLPQRLSYRFPWNIYDLPSRHCVYSNTIMGTCDNNNVQKFSVALLNVISTDSLTDLSLHSLTFSERYGDMENIFHFLCVSRNQTQGERLNAFAIKPYIKNILTLSSVHNRQNHPFKLVNGIDFRKLSNSGSSPGILFQPCILTFLIFTRNISVKVTHRVPECNSVVLSLSGVPDFFDRNKILSGGDLSHYQVPHCIRVFFYFVCFVFIHHNFQFYFELCTYWNILDIYLS